MKCIRRLRVRPWLRLRLRLWLWLALGLRLRLRLWLRLRLKAKVSRFADQSEALLCFASALSSNGGQLSDERGSSVIGSTKSPSSAHVESASLAAAILRVRTTARSRANGVPHEPCRVDLKTSCQQGARR